MGWDFESNSGSKNEFTKFPVGITRIRVVDDEPYVRWTHWLNQFKRAINCPSNDCAICQIRKLQKANKEPYSYPMARRLSMNIINRETGKLEIMEQGVTFFQNLKDLMVDLAEEGKSLKDVDIKVRRRGTEKEDTSYRLDIDKEYPMDENDLALIKNKQDLSIFFAPNTPEQIIRIVAGESWDDVMSNNSESDEPITVE